MRDTNAPDWARFMIEVGMTDADYTEKIINDFDGARMSSDDDWETVVYIYVANQIDLISTLAQLAIYHNIEWCHPHQRDMMISQAGMTWWSWIE